MHDGQRRGPVRHPRPLLRDAAHAGAVRACDLSMSLPAMFGGFGWTHPLHMMGPASAGRVIEVLPWLRDLPELASRIPPPSQWATCKMGALRDAHGFITRLTSSG